MSGSSMFRESRACPECGGTIDPNHDGSWPDQCPHCGYEM